MTRFLEIHRGTYWVWAAALLIVPVRWLLAACLAAIVHEFFHAAAVCLLGGSLLGIRLHPFGASMEIRGLTSWQECFCALAGPFGSFLMFFFRGFLPYVAVCGFFQGLFNLLPIFPLDGGRALRCLLEYVPGIDSASLSDAVGTIVFGFLFLLSIFSFRRFFLVALVLFLRIYILRKRP